ncbi:maleylpyruvate isomerase family mycothiol-dependent enzyme [Actinoplanes sp. CA-030573]|uniref:maleylpyruvate isomerase family mycothiol-dependent enzyme n=1 Tax=Actinoplanes sp. CA-030573 TaxID=3239898 RepID=UPI003D8C1097
MTDHWAVIIERRHAVADLVDGLTAAEWERPSLCAAWSVREVAAHLTLQQLGVGDVLAMLGRWRGTVERTTRHEACRQAARLSPAEIVTTLRDTADRRRHTIGVTPMETLIDLLVHEQDIAIPLGRRRAMPRPAAAAATQRLLTMRFPPPLRSVRAVAGLRLTATDVDWSYGTGPDLRGPIAALLLTAAGRPVMTDQLTGPGLARMHGSLGH